MGGAATRSDLDKGDTVMRCFSATPQLAEALDKTEFVDATGISRILLRTVRRLTGTPAMLVRRWYLDLLSPRADAINAVIIRERRSICRIMQGLILQRQGAYTDIQILDVHTFACLSFNHSSNRS